MVVIVVLSSAIRRGGRRTDRSGAHTLGRGGGALGGSPPRRRPDDRASGPRPPPRRSAPSAPEPEYTRPSTSGAGLSPGVASSTSTKSAGVPTASGVPPRRGAAAPVTIAQASAAGSTAASTAVCFCSSVSSLSSLSRSSELFDRAPSVPRPIGIPAGVGGGIRERTSDCELHVRGRIGDDGRAATRRRARAPRRRATRRAGEHGVPGEEPESVAQVLGRAAAVRGDVVAYLVLGLRQVDLDRSPTVRPPAMKRSVESRRRCRSRGVRDSGSRGARTPRAGPDLRARPPGARVAGAPSKLRNTWLTVAAHAAVDEPRPRTSNWNQYMSQHRVVPARIMSKAREPVPVDVLACGRASAGQMRVSSQRMSGRSSP